MRCSRRARDAAPAIVSDRTANTSTGTSGCEWRRPHHTNQLSIPSPASAGASAEAAVGPKRSTLSRPTTSVHRAAGKCECSDQVETATRVPGAALSRHARANGAAASAIGTPHHQHRTPAQELGDDAGVCRGYRQDGSAAAAADAVYRNRESEQAEENDDQHRLLQRARRWPACRDDCGQQEEEEHHQQGHSDQSQQPGGDCSHAVTIRGLRVPCQGSIMRHRCRLSPRTGDLIPASGAPRRLAVPRSAGPTGRAVTPHPRGVMASSSLRRTPSSSSSLVRRYFLPVRGATGVADLHDVSASVSWVRAAGRASRVGCADRCGHVGQVVCEDAPSSPLTRGRRRRVGAC